MDNKNLPLKERETINKKSVEKLSQEDLEKVAGGASSNKSICPYCGMEFDKFGNILSEMEIKWHMAQHYLEENIPK